MSVYLKSIALKENDQYVGILLGPDSTMREPLNETQLTQLRPFVQRVLDTLQPPTKISAIESGKYSIATENGESSEELLKSVAKVLDAKIGDKLIVVQEMGMGPSFNIRHRPLDFTVADGKLVVRYAELGDGTFNKFEDALKAIPQLV